MLWIVLLIFFILVMVLLAHFAQSRLAPSSNQMDYPYKLKPELMSAAERSFYKVLASVAPSDAVVFSKVRIADIVDIKKGLSASERTSAFNKISAKHFDFVICDKASLSVLSVVELDDKTHQKPKTIDRDKLVNGVCSAAGLTLKRVKAQRAYVPADIRQQIFGLELAAPQALTEVKTQSLIVDNHDALEWREYQLFMSAKGIAQASEQIKRAEKREP